MKIYKTAKFIKRQSSFESTDKLNLPAEFDPAETLVSVTYFFEPEEPRTWDDPGSAASLEIEKVILNGKDIADTLPDWVMKKIEQDCWYKIEHMPSEYDIRSNEEDDYLDRI